MSIIAEQEMKMYITDIEDMTQDCLNAGIANRIIQENHLVVYNEISMRLREVADNADQNL